MIADKPNEDPNVRGDPFKTLIVARLSYEADEHDLEKEFGRFGPIERVCILAHPLSRIWPPLWNVQVLTNLAYLQIRIVTDTHAHEKGNKKKKPHRGYAFVVFEREKDMRGNTTIDFFQTIHLGPLDPFPSMSLTEIRPSSLPISSHSSSHKLHRPEKV